MKRSYLVISTIAASLAICGCASMCGKHSFPAEESEGTAIPDYSKDKRAVRIMTYNVGVFGKYIDNSIPLVADLLKEAKPDIVGLNELDSCNRRHLEYQLEELNTCLGKGWNYVFQSMFPYQDGGYGVGVETRRKVVGTRSYDIPKTPGVKHMGLLAVETEDFVFMTTHLNVSGAVSKEQARLINDYVRKDYWSSGKPVFLAGDMNSRPDSETMAELAGYWTVISAKEPTFPSGSPDRCIDYILILNNIRGYTVVKSAACTGFRNGDVKIASDHIPVFVDVILP